MRPALERADGPTSLLLSRQAVPFVAAGARDAAGVARGGYVLSESAGRAQAVVIATGSEVPLAIEAQKQLAAAGVRVRVVSLPSTTVFDRQPESYKAKVLPAGIPRIAVEAGVTDFWWKYVRESGAVLGVDRYGESAPAAAVFKHFGLTAENLVAVVQTVLSKRRGVRG